MKFKEKDVVKLLLAGADVSITGTITGFTKSRALVKINSIQDGYTLATGHGATVYTATQNLPEGAVVIGINDVEAFDLADLGPLEPPKAETISRSEAEKLVDGKTLDTLLQSGTIRQTAAGEFYRQDIAMVSTFTENNRKEQLRTADEARRRELAKRYVDAV